LLDSVSHLSVRQVAVVIWRTFAQTPCCSSAESQNRHAVEGDSGLTELAMWSRF